MTLNLTTTAYRLKEVFHWQSEILNANNNSNNFFWFFAGNYLPQTNAVAAPNDITNNTEVALWTNMLFGKQVTANNVYPMINNNQWVANTVYSRYDDIESSLPLEAFFVITNEGSYNHIWKVLDNNFESPSIDQPSIAFANNTPYFQTADGYKWFYLTSILAATANLFLTSNYFPLVANSTVTAAAVPGALESFFIQAPGAFYNNYIAGTFFASDLTIGGSGYQYNISNTQVNTTNGFCTGCLLYISSGTGAGQYATITDYSSNSLGNIITLNNPLVPQPVNGSTYQISPQVNIVSDGLQTINAVARCLVNALSSNAIYDVQTLQAGAGYITIQNISVSANVVVGVSNTANVRSVIAPRGGHGSNVFSELYCNSLGISVTLANTENNTILTTNQYQQIGLMKNARFANVNINFSGLQSVFNVGETIYSFFSNQIASAASITLGSSNVTCNTANFQNQIAANGTLLISNGTSYQLLSVNAITNTSQITINSPGLFTCTACQLYYVNLTGSAIVTNTGGANVIVTNATPTFTSTMSVIGNTSGAYGTVNAVSRNGTTEYFNTFIQLYKYTATMLNGAFTNSEKVTQGNNSANIFTANGTTGTVLLYLSNFVGGPFVNGTILGVTSGASATITASWPTDLIYGSAEVLYIENLSTPVMRANAQSETFLLILNC